MKYCLIKNTMVIAPDVDNTVFTTAIECPDDIFYGDHYIDGQWIRDGERIPVPDLTPAQQREQAYETMLYNADGGKLIEWEGEAITVDQANDLWLKYSAEGNTIADTLSGLIVNAKEYIRQLYPDEV